MRSPSGSRAAAYARVRAWKSRLLGRLEANALLVAVDSAALQRTLAALGIEPGFDRLLRAYRMAFRTVPDAAPLLRALLHRLEIENVKLLWRTAVRHRDPATSERHHRFFRGARDRILLLFEPLVKWIADLTRQAPNAPTVSPRRASRSR